MTSPLTVQPTAPNGHATVRTSLLGQAVARTRWRDRRRRASTRIRLAWVRFRPYALVTAGLGCGVAAAFTVAAWAGLLAGMCACLLLEWRAGG